MNRLIHLIAAATAAALLAACGGGGGGSTAGAPTDPKPGPLETPTPQTPRPAVTDIGAPLGAIAASRRIGPAGGRLDAPDHGLAVIVPPGAFASEQLVTLQPVEAKAPGALGTAWRIGPEGMTASQPITLEWRPTPAQRQGTARLRIASQAADRTWRMAKAGSDTEGVVRTTTTHFSDWSLVAGAQLRPGTAEVALGQGVTLSVVHCPRGDLPDLPEQVQYPCQLQLDGAIYTVGWAVNGVPGGSPALGMLGGAGGAIDGPAQRRYQAPAALPPVNPVAVTVEYRDPLGGALDGTVQLVSNITVIDPQAGCAWLAGVPSMRFALDYDHVWAGGNDLFEANYVNRGRVTATLQRDPQTPIGGAWFVGSLDSGTVEVDHLSRHPVGGSAVTVKGRGGPVGGAGLPDTVRVMVDLQSCQLMLAASAFVQAQKVSTGPDGPPITETVNSGASIAVVGFDVGGRAVLTQSGLLPALHGGGMASDYFSIDVPDGLEGPAGEARVTWSLTPP